MGFERVAGARREFHALRGLVLDLTPRIVFCFTDSHAQVLLEGGLHQPLEEGAEVRGGR